ncbi:DnaJ C-terminal domain-containing protein [Prochlorococcus sp. MIT 1307]|uniref:DnaJ C-terminal domain-containing protein n=1 Tax=Prochlorococcus sp. MIT 1307 TaxID=3096219 RepID=UPI002A756570|nr:DnaJ C-terminal domain-containing protein [Prochlorococcus sp. MIT 1307]
MTSIDNPNYWSLLGISPDSNPEQLKRAFRREARRWHPDLNVNDSQAEERFKLVNEAYAVLSDPRKRKVWEDSLNLYSENQDPFSSGFPDFNKYLDVVLGIPIDSEQEEEEDQISVEFSYNSPEKSSPPSSPPVQVTEDLETLIELSPEEALYGTSVELELIDGTIVEIRTPPFAGDGWRLRLAGVALGGRDHFLQLRVQTDDGLRIDGLRVLYKLELFPPEAVLGCAVDIPTLTGQVTLQVPPRSSSGRLLRLRGRGLEFEGRRGDQLVEIVVVIPADLGDAEDALYKRLQEISLEGDQL